MSLETLESLICLKDWVKHEVVNVDSNISPHDWFDACFLISFPYVSVLVLRLIAQQQNKIKKQIAQNIKNTYLFWRHLSFSSAQEACPLYLPDTGSAQSLPVTREDPVSDRVPPGRQGPDRIPTRNQAQSPFRDGT